MSKGKGSFPKFCFPNNNGQWDSESTLALREGKGSLGTFSRFSAVLSGVSGQILFCGTLVLVGYIIQEGPEVATNLFLVLLFCKYISDISVSYRHIHCTHAQNSEKHTIPFPPTLPNSAFVSAVPPLLGSFSRNASPLTRMSHVVQIPPQI